MRLGMARDDASKQPVLYNLALQGASELRRADLKTAPPVNRGRRGGLAYLLEMKALAAQRKR